MFLARLRRIATNLLFITAAAIVVFACAHRVSRITLLPPPDLREPADRFTGARLQSLADNAQLCRIVLEEAGIRHSILPARATPEGCGYTAAVRLTPTPGAPAWAPAGLATACPVAAALVLWERDVLRPAAQRHFGEPVARVDHYGAYSCRRLYGRETGSFSEHARANAVDVAGFQLRSGRTITLARHWNGTAAEQAFLRDIRDGACRTFATVLSPDYNAAHADHFHFDQAARGRVGRGVCR